MPGVDVHGPDGKQYQFPDGTTKEAAIAYFKKNGIGVQAPAAQVSGASQGAPSAPAAPSAEPSAVPSGADWLHAVGLPASRAEGDLSPTQMMKVGGTQILHAADPTYMLRSVLGPMVKEGARGLKGIWEHGGIPEPMDTVHTLSSVNPFAAPVINQMTEQREQGKEGEATATGILGAGTLALGEALPKAVQFFKPGLPEAANTILGNAATKVKQTVGQGGPIHQAVSEHFGKLTNDIVAADYASGKKIPVSDLWDKALEYADDYAADAAHSKTTPKFNAIVQELQNRPVELTWKELHDLQMNVDKAASGAAEGSRDAGAANQMRASIARKLDEKAAEVGRGDQWDAAKTIWHTLREYQGEGVLKKLLDTGTDPVAPGGVAEGGKQFFDILRDKANQPKLNEINQNFKPYGLPDNYFSNTAKAHAPLHDYVSILGEPKSRVKLMMKHPFSAAPGIIVGGAAGTASGVPAGGFIGGTVGGSATALAAARMKAAGAVERLGGRPETITPMADAAKVQPVGTGEKPTPPAPKPGAVSFNDLVSVLIDQGYKKADAQRFAMRGIEQFPNDFGNAFNVAIKGDRSEPISGGSGTYSRDPRSKAQMLEDIRALKEGGRSLRKDK